MRYADTDTLRSLNERAAQDGLMCVDESVLKDVAPTGVHLCDWATPFGPAGTSSHFMTVWIAETRAGEPRQFSMNVRRADLLDLPEIPASPAREFDTDPVPRAFPGFSSAELDEFRQQARQHRGD